MRRRAVIRAAHLLFAFCAGFVWPIACRRSSVPDDTRCLAATAPVARARPDGDWTHARWHPPERTPIRLVELDGVVDGTASPRASVLAGWVGAETIAFTREPLEHEAGLRLRGPALEPPVTGAARLRVRLKPGGAHRVRVIPFGSSMANVEMQRTHRAVDFALEHDADPEAPVDLSLDLGAVLHGNWTDAADSSGLSRIELELPGATAERVSIEHVVVEDEAARFASEPAGRDAIERDGIVRPSWFVHGGSRVRFSLRVPEGMSELRWYDAAIGGPSRAVRVVASGESTRLAEAAGAGEWTKRRAPLGRFSAREVVLEFEASGSGTAFFGDPQIVVPEPAPETPDVVLYLIDTLRADALGAFGSPKSGVSPVIDALAREGIVFARAISTSSWTKPALPSLLSGLHPLTHAVGASGYTDRLPAGVPVVQEAFRRAGWRTGSFAASPLGSTLSGLDRGFDAACTPQHWNVAAGDLEHPEARQLHEAMLGWIDEEPDRPFFAFVHTLEVHEWKRDRYARDLPAGWDPYDAAVRAADRQLGELLAALGARGRRPLVVLLSDHGESFGEHGVRGHGTSLFQSQLHVPLVVSARGVLPPMTITEPVGLLDVAPTILDLVGLPPLPAQEGASLACWPREGRGPERATPDGVSSELTRFVWRPDAPKWRSLVARDARKLIRIEGRAPLAYDLATDPCETNPRSERVAILAPQLDAHIASEASAHAALEAQFGTGANAVIDAADVERLRALGYVP